MNIRLEQPEDYREVENLTREAFWNVYCPGCKEHFVLNQYRNNPDFIPELDFVMEEDEKIIGHVMFSKATIVKMDGTPFPAWTFGPISIHPDYKRKGYGLKLLQYSIEKAREFGIGVLCMEGNIDFYKHAGFVLASSLKIQAVTFALVVGMDADGTESPGWEKRAIQLHDSRFGKHHMSDDFFVFFHHEIEFGNEVRIISVLIEHKMLLAPRTIYIPKCLAGEVLHLAVIFGSF